jgi:general secretion pathway protein E
MIQSAHRASRAVRATNNAAGGITRLLDMGVEVPLTSTVNGIAPPRAARARVHAGAQATPEVIAEFGLRRFQPGPRIHLWRPKPSPLSLTGLGRGTIMNSS